MRKEAKLAAGISSVIALAAIIGTVAYTQAIANDKEQDPAIARCFDRLEEDEKWVESGTTAEVPFYVQVSWNPYELKTSDKVNFEISMKDSETMQPLSDVTYDFMFKGSQDVGIIQDRYVTDFGSIPADIVTANINYPCDISVVVFIDKVGQRSFKPADQNDDNADSSPVLVQLDFHLLRNN